MEHFDVYQFEVEYFDPVDRKYGQEIIPASEAAEAKKLFLKQNPYLQVTQIEMIP